MSPNLPRGAPTPPSIPIMKGRGPCGARLAMGAGGLTAGWAGGLTTGFSALHIGVPDSDNAHASLRELAPVPPNTTIRSPALS